MSFARPGDVPADASAPPMDREIREQLARIRASPAFDAPDRAQKFLSYVVEEALQGRADRIKAYSVALEVFGRDASFDAQNDPVVRIEAGRVRRALEHYYLLAGQKDPILITIPKGGYVPTFTHLNEPLPEQRPEQPEQDVSWRRTKARKLALFCAAVLVLGAGWMVLDGPALQRFSTIGSGAAGNTVPAMPTVVVAPFEDITGTPGSSLLARGLTDEVIGQMARFKEIRVVAGRSPAADAPAAVSALPHYGLEGRIRLDRDRFRLSARLVNRVDGAIIWTNAYDAQIGERKLLDIETEIAGDIATALAQPYGVIFQADASEIVDAPTREAKAYACALSYYGYRADLRRQTHAAVQGCLKEVVAAFPNYATAWALLSLTYLDELRFRYRLDPPDRAEPAARPPVDLAVEAAERAVELDPGNVRALQAEMLALYFNGDVRSALAVGERALAINPNDTEFAGEFGFRLALAGQWGRGCRLISSSVERNPGPMDYFQSALAVCSYMNRDYQEAERWARTANLRDNPIFHLILTAIYGQRGKLDEARLERQWLESHAPEYLADTRRQVTTRILRVQDQDHFIDGLRKAGLDIAPATMGSPRALNSEDLAVEPGTAPG